jgi:membrane-associated phospholipid phosphatase
MASFKRTFLTSLLLVVPLAAQTQNQAHVDFHSVVPNILSDQKRIWTAPAHMKRQYLWPTLAFAGVTAALIATDGASEHYFHSTKDLQTFNHVFSGTNTLALTLATPVAFYVAGRGRTDAYATQTAFLAGEALVDAGIVDYALKTAFNRKTPDQFKDRSTTLWDTWFDAPGSRFGAHGSFPSGHTTAAFSVATVVARRYGRQHRWVPYAAYGVASAIGFSRLTNAAHYPSDVFVGAALGYSISRFAVLGRYPER